VGNISQSARNPYGFILVRNRLKRLKELVYRSGGSWESSLREDFSLSVRFCPNSPFAPYSALPGGILSRVLSDRLLSLLQKIESQSHS